MNNLNKYLKIARNVLIKPEEKSIEDKILNRLAIVNEKDKEILDDNFLDYLKKSNSRFYLFMEKIRNNPGKVSVLFIFVLLITGLFILLLKSENSNRGKD